MTQQKESGSDPAPANERGIVKTTENPGGTRQEEIGTGGVHGKPGIVYNESPTTVAEQSNTENPFAEEHTEGFDIAPTGSGDLEDK